MNISFKFLAFLILSISLFEKVSSSRFFEKSIEYNYDFSVKFDYPRNFDCACISGLWRLYSEVSVQRSKVKGQCSEVELATVGGDEQFCFKLPDDSRISKVEQILEDKNSISISNINNNDFTTISEDAVYRIELGSNDTFTTGIEWTLEDEAGNEICLANYKGSYCFFSADNFGIKSIVKISKGCKDGLSSVLPISCVTNNPENKNICKERLVKRATKEGRVFFGGPGQNLTVFKPNITDENSTDIYDEDYSNSTVTNKTDDAIASEIWNFLDSKLDEILGLKDQEGFNSIKPIDPSKKDDTDKRNKRAAPGGRRNNNIKGRSSTQILLAENKTGNLTKSYKSPVYQFLELAREVMQKTCPPGYVNPEFFDLVTTTFIKIQKKHYKFPEGATNYFGYWRILESLKACIANVSYFNFTIDNCTSREKPVSGTYCAYGNCSMEINTYGGFENFDPLIETAWNIFKNAHSVCFNHFDKNFNDHHRFTMWMVPLFQNKINDIWRNGSAKGVVYGGVFGNQENVQTAVSYCTAASQMLSKYPWDLPRPEKINELTTFAGRRKRNALGYIEQFDLDLSAQPLSPLQSLSCS